LGLGTPSGIRHELDVVLSSGMTLYAFECVRPKYKPVDAYLTVPRDRHLRPALSGQVVDEGAQLSAQFRESVGPYECHLLCTIARSSASRGGAVSEPTWHAVARCVSRAGRARAAQGSTELGGFLFLRNLSFDRGPLLLALFLLRHLAVVGGIAAVEGRGESRKIERGLRRRPARWAGLVK
jgi:hypothetical protein